MVVTCLTLKEITEFLIRFLFPPSIFLTPSKVFDLRILIRNMFLPYVIDRSQNYSEHTKQPYHILTQLQQHNSTATISTI